MASAWPRSSAAGPGESSGGVEEGDEGHTDTVGKAHQALRLAEAFGHGRAEVPEDVRLGIGALLVTDDHDRPSVQQGGAAHYGWVVAEGPIAVELDELVEHLRDQGQRARALRVAGQLDAAPRRVGGLGADLRRIGLDGHLGRLGHRPPPDDRPGVTSVSIPAVSLTAPPTRWARPCSMPIGRIARRSVPSV